MKKLILSAFVLAALASCAKNEVDMTSTISEATPISFSDINDRITKTANISGDNYQLYAWSTLADETSWFMDVIVGGSDGETYISTDGENLTAYPHYWPEQDATINFRAFCPDKISMGTKSEVPSGTSDAADCYLTGGTGTINYATYDAIADTHKVGFTYNAGLGREDVTLCDVEQTVNKSNGTVDLQFAHLLSAITIKVELSAAQTALEYEIANPYTDIDIQDPYTISLQMPRKRATYEFGLDSTDPEECTMDYPKNADGSYATATPVTYTYTPTTLMYVIPQDLLLPSSSSSTSSDVSTTVTIDNLKITKKGSDYYQGSPSINLYTALSNACAIDKFEAGKQYNITIVFDDGASGVFDNKITFKASNDSWDTYDIIVTVTSGLYSEFASTSAGGGSVE